MGLKSYFRDMFDVWGDFFNSDEPCMHQDIVDILDDEELSEEYMERVNNSKGPVVDVSDIVDKLYKKRETHGQ